MKDLQYLTVLSGSGSKVLAWSSRPVTVFQSVQLFTEEKRQMQHKRVVSNLAGSSSSAHVQCHLPPTVFARCLRSAASCSWPTDSTTFCPLHSSHFQCLRHAVHHIGGTSKEQAVKTILICKNCNSQCLFEFQMQNTGAFSATARITLCSSSDFRCTVTESRHSVCS